MNDYDLALERHYSGLELQIDALLDDCSAMCPTPALSQAMWEREGGPALVRALHVAQYYYLEASE